MQFGRRRFGLEIALPCEQRYARRGVPGVEIRASGPSCIFHRVSGVVDSGASRTLLTAPTAKRLGLHHPRKDYAERIEAAGGTIDFEVARVQFRIPVHGRPPVSFYIDAGISRQVGENLFGSDFLQYFFILLGPQQVFFLADEHLIEERTET
jgi:hypothetical protein